MLRRAKRSRAVRAKGGTGPSLRRCHRSSLYRNGETARPREWLLLPWQGPGPRGFATVLVGLPSAPAPPPAPNKFVAQPLISGMKCPADTAGAVPGRAPAYPSPAALPFVPAGFQSPRRCQSHDMCSDREVHSRMARERHGLPSAGVLRARLGAEPVPLCCAHGLGEESKRGTCPHLIPGGWQTPHELRCR